MYLTFGKFPRKPRLERCGGCEKDHISVDVGAMRAGVARGASLQSSLVSLIAEASNALIQWKVARRRPWLPIVWQSENQQV